MIATKVRWVAGLKLNRLNSVCHTFDK